jgi:hypothetical protein
MLCLQHQGDAATAAAALDAVIRPQVGKALKLLAAADDQQQLQQQEVCDSASGLVQRSAGTTENNQACPEAVSHFVHAACKSPQQIIYEFGVC